MTDLTQYYSVRARLRPGDVLVFYGTSFLSRLIEGASRGPGHAAIVRQSLTEGQDVIETESTIDRSLNGVQSHPLGQMLAGYSKGTTAAALLLDESVRKRIDWQKFYAYVGSIDGIVKYDIPGLFEFLLPEAIDRMEPSKEMVCSVTVGAVLSRCGAISNINWAKMRPQDLVELGIYSEYVPLLGNPKLHNFNTIL